MGEGTGVRLGFEGKAFLDFRNPLFHLQARFQAQATSLDLASSEMTETRIARGQQPKKPVSPAKNAQETNITVIIGRWWKVSSSPHVPRDDYFGRLSSAARLTTPTNKSNEWQASQGF